MDNLNDLKKIWLTADTTSLPKHADMIVFIKRYRKQKIIKKTALIGMAVGLVALMVFVVFFYRSTTLSTRIGEAGIIISGIILIYTNINSLGRMYKLKNCSNKAFLEHIKQVDYNRLFYYKKTQVVALSFNSLGLLFYLFEVVHHQLVIAIIAYGLTISWFVVLWLVIRPRAFKKQTGKYNQTVNEMQKIAKQL